jgi:PemK-like, MazF-like toxin of type II toxin-antitoxin system
VATWGSLLRQAAEVGLKLLTQPKQEQGGPARTHAGERAPARPRPSTGGARTAPARDRGRRIAYAPDLDGAADPGEIVWTWVPFEEDDGRGKDRPVLVVGREGRDLVGLMLSSQSERADDRNWIDIGSGSWDGQGRPSYVRLDRVIEVGEHEIRREGAVLDEARFDRVAAELRSQYGWS